MAQRKAGTRFRVSGWVALACFAATVTGAKTAGADDKAACLDATSEGQRLRDAHKLLEARAKFRLCAAAGCPAVVQSDCAGWLDALEKDLPTVVVLAKNGAGAPLVAVSVSVDGQPFATELHGEALPIDPGSHTFHFEQAGGATHDELAVITEGGKNQMVVAVMGAAPPSAPVAAPAPAPSSAPGAAPAAAPSQATAAPSNLAATPAASPLRTLGWVVGGAGVAGLAVGTIFGVVALGDKSGAHCGSNNLCDPGSSAGIKSAALVSDIGWVAGGLLAAGGLGLVLLAPGGGADHAGQVRVGPLVVAQGCGASVAGAW